MSCSLLRSYLQAYNLSKDHKPDLEIERERILKAGGYIQVGRINGTLNLARAIGTLSFALTPEFKGKYFPSLFQIVCVFNGVICR